MMQVLSSWRDRFLGRGEASVTVPPLDGALKPNNLLEEAPAAFSAPEPDNLVLLGDRALYSSGVRVLCGQEELLAALSPVTAMAASRAGVLAVASVAEGVQFFDASMRPFGRAVDTLKGVTAMTFLDDGALVVCVGAAERPTSEWQRDLLTHGRSGSIWRIAVENGEKTRIAAGLAFPNGVLGDGAGNLIVSESWRKRLIRIPAKGGAAAQVLEDLPGYPARLAPSERGGYWLCVFAPRSQLIEFVLREPKYRAAMMAEVDPRYWIAPTLRSGVSFREPMQGGALKQMGILKPWAPTRSYGLAIELNRDFQPVRSLHSRAGGRRHGITSALDHGGRLWLTSKGGDAVIALETKQQVG